MEFDQMNKFDSCDAIISHYDKLLPIIKIVRILSNENTNINNSTLTEAQIHNLNNIKQKFNSKFDNNFFNNKDKNDQS